MRKSTHEHKLLNRVVLALAVIFILNGIAMADRAEKGDWHDHAREAHEWRQQHWHNGRLVYGDGGYVTYAPPLVVEPPPPAYYTPEPGISIVVPLHLR